MSSRDSDDEEDDDRIFGREAGGGDGGGGGGGSGDGIEIGSRIPSLSGNGMEFKNRKRLIKRKSKTRRSDGGGSGGMTDRDSEMNTPRMTNDDRASGMSMERLGSDATGIGDRASDNMDGSIGGPSPGDGERSSGKQKRNKHRLNFQVGSGHWPVLGQLSK